MLFPTNGKEFMQLRVDVPVNLNANSGRRTNSQLPSSTIPLFDKVGAGARVVFTANSSQLLFINEAGDQMMYWEGNANIPSRRNIDITDKARVNGVIRGPFVLK